MKKYKVQIIAIATASKVIAEIEVDSYEEYLEKVQQIEDKGEYSLTANASNDFDVDDPRLEEIPESDMKYYLNKKS